MSTPAIIESEVAEAQHTRYEPVLHLDSIKPHPRNIRHDAIADSELVASIVEVGVLEPLIVAPDGDDTYVLIAGHRRLDGCHKAGRTSAPAVVRLDLTEEADQVAAMLVENGRRKDLTPLEEAEGYGQLRFDFGWKPGAIAKAAGHNVDTINKRLKLLKLDDKVKTNLDDGQLNIEDAIAISDLPKAEQTKLAKTAGTPSFKWDLGRAKERVKKKAATAKLVEQLDAAGVPKLKLPAAHGIYSVNHADHGMTRLGSTFSSDRDDHVGCLAYVLDKNYDGVDEVEYVCTNVPGHDEQLDDQRRAEREEQARRDREHEERVAAERIARGLRLDAVLSTIKPGLKIPPAIIDLARAVTPALVAQLDQHEVRYYCDLLEIPEEDRWRPQTYMRKKDDVEKFDRHITPIATGKSHHLVRTFVAAIAARIEARAIDYVEYRARNTHPWERLVLDDTLAWLTLVESTGQALTPVDLELRDLCTGTTEDADA